MSEVNKNEQRTNPQAIGQAYGLAVQDAIKNNKENDLKYIIKRYIVYKQYGEMFQKATLENLAVAIEREEFLQKANELKESL